MQRMPYPVHAMPLGEALSREILGPDYDVYEVMYFRRRLPCIQKFRIRTGTVHYPLADKRVHNAFARMSYYKNGLPDNWSFSFSFGDRNMPVNGYNDHYLFTEWHRAVQYMIQCYEDSLAKSPENLTAMMDQAQKVKPADGKTYMFSWKPSKPITDGPRLGDILAEALQRHANAQKSENTNDYFGRRWGIKRY